MPEAKLLAVLRNHFLPARALTNKPQIRKQANKYCFEMLKRPNGCLTWIDKETKERNYLRTEGYSENHSSPFRESIPVPKMVQSREAYEVPPPPMGLSTQSRHKHLASSAVRETYNPHGKPNLSGVL